MRARSPCEHAANLRQRHVRLVDEEQVVVREVVQQGPGHGRPAWRPARWRLNSSPRRSSSRSRASISRSKWVRCSRRAASRILPSALSTASCSSSSCLMAVHGLLQLLGVGHEVLGRVDVELVALAQDLAGERVQRHDALDLVAPELHAHGHVLVGRVDVQRVAADAEGAAAEVHVVALVPDVDEVAQHLVPPPGLALLERDDDVAVFLGAAQSVDARDRGHDEGVAAGEERLGGGVAQTVDLIVDAGVFLDVGVGPRRCRLPAGSSRSS